MNSIKEVIEKQKRAIITGVAKFRKYFAFYNEETNQVDFEVQGSALGTIEAPGTKVTNLFSIPAVEFQRLLKGDGYSIEVKTEHEGVWSVALQHLPKKSGVLFIIDPQDGNFYSEYHLFITDLPVIAIKEKLEAVIFNPNKIIRKDVNGVEVNYGDLVMMRIDGITAYANKRDAEYLGYPYSIPEKDSSIEPFFTGLPLHVRDNDFDARKDKIVWVTDKAHLRKLGAILSKGRYAMVTNCARNLMVWTDGEITFGPVTPDLYYLEVSKEDMEYCTI